MEIEIKKKRNGKTKQIIDEGLLLNNWQQILNMRIERKVKIKQIKKEDSLEKYNYFINGETKPIRKETWEWVKDWSVGKQVFLRRRSGLEIKTAEANQKDRRRRRRNWENNAIWYRSVKACSYNFWNSKNLVEKIIFEVDNGFCCKCLCPQSLSFVMAHLFQSGFRTLEETSFLCFPDLSQTNKMRRN